MVVFRRSRGQAFETMMLVISVIVAVAILGVLLGFLGNLGNLGAGAKSVMPDLAKKVESRGVGIEVKDNVQFEKDDTILRSDVKGASSIILSQIEFVCAQSEFCSASDAPVQVKSDRVHVTQRTSGGVALCSGDGSKFYVCVAKTTADADKECTSKCRI